MNLKWPGLRGRCTPPHTVVVFDRGAAVRDCGVLPTPPPPRTAGEHCSGRAEADERMCALHLGAAAVG
eukprot:1100570-Prorocentrum_minimum.AAC.1